MRRRVAILAATTLLALVLGAFVLFRLQSSSLTLTFTREDLQERVAARFPVEQKVVLVAVTYSNPVIKLDEGSDRIGIALEVAAKIAGAQLGKGTVEGDWEVHYDPAEGAVYFDDLRILKFDVKGLPPSTQAGITTVASPLIQEYLRRAPVYRLKPGDLGRDFARSALKSVTVKDGKLHIVLGVD